MFFSLAYHSLAQNDNRFQYLDDNTGAMATSIHMMQDSYGYIWASTLSGVTRYDGESYHHYVKSDSIDGLPDVFAYCTYEDKNKNIWVALYGYGIAILNRDSDLFRWIEMDTISPNGLHLSKIKAIANDNFGNIYLLGEDGIQRVHLEGDNYEKLNFELQNDFLPNVNENITGLSLLNDSRGTFWIGSKTGFYTIDKNRRVEKNGSIRGLKNRITRSILEDSSGDIYLVRSDESLLKFDAKKKDFEFDTSVVFPNQNILSVIDQKDYLWSFIRPNRVYKYDLQMKKMNKFETFELPYNILGSYFRAPFVSKEGTLWLAGAGSFPFQHQPKTNKEITPIIYDNTKMQSSTCVYVDEDNIYIGQLLGGIKILDKKSGETKMLSKGNSALIDDRIYQIVEIDKNRLVIMGRMGVYVYDRNIHKIIKVKRFNTLIRNGCYLGGDIMWVSGDTKRIYRLNLVDMSVTSIFDSEDALPEAQTVTQMVEDSDGSIWIGGRHQGLYHYFPETGKCDIYTKDSSDPKFKLFTSMIEAIYIDHKGDVWVGGRSGIDIINKATQTISTLGSSNGLKHVHICDITQDDSLNYWILTEKDISRIDKRTRVISSFDSKDGFMNNLYYYRSFAKYNGNLFVAGESGVDKFNPNNIGINLVPPQVVLSGVRIMGKEYLSEVALESIDKINVDHDQNFIDLHILPLHFVAPNKNKIAYKIEGAHNDYIDIENRRNISLSGLSSGIHSLWVKGSNSDNVWSDPKKIIIDVAYPWWRTWVFLFCAFLFFGIMIWWILRKYLDNIRETQIEKEKINTQMAELELKALSSQMNPHFLFNSLNSIKSLINQNKNSEASIFITRYSRLIRQILNNSRSKFVRLQEEIDVICLYLELEKLRLGNSFKYDIDIEQNVGADFIEVPPSLLQPYIENSIWHGLLNKESGNKHLSIKISKKNSFLEIRIIDNGIGRKASKIIQSGSILKNKSLGTLISKERINLFSDAYGYESTVVILDLMDKDGLPRGTEVKILLHVGV